MQQSSAIDESGSLGASELEGSSSKYRFFCTFEYFRNRLYAGQPIQFTDRNLDIEQVFNDTMIWISKMIPQYSVKDLYEVPDMITVIGLAKRAEVIQRQRARKDGMKI